MGLLSWIRHHALYLAWMIALIAVFSSVYFGEILDMEPCRLCWYQRIGMFPLVLFLGIAFYKHDDRIARYSVPLVVFGGFFAFYQSLSQIFPKLHFDFLCGESSCTVAGAIPYFSFAAFTAIFGLIFLNQKDIQKK